MKFALYIAKKYLNSRKEKSFVQKISNICIIIVALSIAIPILVLSVFGGFHKTTGNKIITVEGDIRVIPPYIDFTNYNEVIDIIKNDASISHHIKEVIPYFSAYGIVKRAHYQHPIRIMAIPSDFYQNSDIYSSEAVNSNPVRRNLPTLENDREIVVGRNLQYRLGASPNTDISVYVPLSINPVSINVQEKEFILSGSFVMGFNKYDDSLGIMRFEDVPDSFGIQDYATGLIIYLRNQNNYRRVLRNLNNIEVLNKYSFVASQDEGLFLDFKREKTLMRIALIILVLASFLTIYITLNVVVMEKKKEIGIMKAFGVNASKISQIFIIEGFLIGIIGSFIGVTLGMFMAVNLADIIRAFEFVVSSFSCNIANENLPFKNWFNLSGQCEFMIIPDNTFYITNMPSHPQYMDVIIQTIGAILASVLASYFPSTRASKQKAVEVLMHK